jgi:hypothetical protein
MSLCTVCPPKVCTDVKININIENTTKVPHLGHDTGAYLSIYNYSVQRFITRSLKFITAYYDFVGGMINSSITADPTLISETGINNGECCDGDPNASTPSPAYPSQVKDRVFQAWQWVWERLEAVDSFDLFCEPDCLLQPVLTLLTLAGGDKSSAFRNVLLKKSLTNLNNPSLHCREANQTNPCCGDLAACAVTVGTSGCGKDYNDQLFFNWTQDILGVIDIINTILDSLDMTDDAMSAETLLHKICDCYVKCACCDANSDLPGGKNDYCNTSVLSCFNRCGQPYNGRQIISNKTSTLNIVQNTYGGCDDCVDAHGKYTPPPLDNVPCEQAGVLKLGSKEGDGNCCLPANLPCADEECENANNGAYFIPSTRERLQAAIFVLDWVAFLLFDRDADSSQFSDTAVFSSGNSYCPDWEGENAENANKPLTSSSWLKSRCKLGTGNGKCVVAAGACREFRRVDDFKPMQTMIASMKTFIQLLSVPYGEGYQEQVTDVYNGMLSNMHDLYLGETDLTFHVDCAAPQFCCTTEWTQAGRILAAARPNNHLLCENPCACCNLTIPEYTVQCFARLKCSCIGPTCEQPVEPKSCCTNNVYPSPPNDYYS